VTRTNDGGVYRNPLRRAKTGPAASAGSGARVGSDSDGNLDLESGPKD
jgi:hypothetical protein